MKYVILTVVFISILLFFDFSAQSHNVENIQQAPCYQALQTTLDDMYNDTQHIKKAQLSHTTFPLRKGKNDN